MTPTDIKLHIGIHPDDVERLQLLAARIGEAFTDIANALTEYAESANDPDLPEHAEPHQFHESIGTKPWLCATCGHRQDRPWHTNTTAPTEDRSAVRDRTEPVADPEPVGRDQVRDAVHGALTPWLIADPADPDEEDAENLETAVDAVTDAVMALGGLTFEMDVTPAWAEIQRQADDTAARWRQLAGDYLRNRPRCTCGPTPNDGRYDDPRCPIHGEPSTLTQPRPELSTLGRIGDALERIAEAFTRPTPNGCTCTPAAGGIRITPGCPIHDLQPRPLDPEPDRTPPT